MAITDQQWLDHANQNVQEFSNRQIMLKGIVSPPGSLPAPIGAFYKNQANGDRYEKTSAPDTGWTLFSTGGGGPHDHNEIVEVRSCDPTLVVNDLVWEDTVTPGNVAETINNTDKRRVIGICIEKVTSTLAKVMFRGPLSGFSGLVPGMKVYCSPSGVISSVMPTSGYMQVLGDAISTSAIDFSPSHQRVLRA